MEDNEARLNRYRAEREANRIRCAELHREFMLSTRGVPAWTVGRAMGILVSGINWCGSPKGRIAEAWADAQVNARAVYPQMKYVTLERLRQKIAVLQQS